ncbi:OsmC family protein [Alkalihalobacillus sp. 1P02AB]|uniref:OsmC family protein n=1 Tax=Alkalihalobacillus sp. 1P02AB TaxID=3132260 RepID=UPI0039A57A9A
MVTTVKWKDESMFISNGKNVEINGATIHTNDIGYSPVELITSSLGLCVFISLTKLFERDQIEIEKEQLAVTVSASKAEGSPSRLEKFDVTVQFPTGLDNAYREKLLKSAERACTIGNTIQQGAKINMNQK